MKYVADNARIVYKYNDHPCLPAINISDKEIVEFYDQLRDANDMGILIGSDL